jgi:hypothetical protein
LLAEYNSVDLSEPIRLEEKLEQKQERAGAPAAETKSSQTINFKKPSPPTNKGGQR